MKKTLYANGKLLLMGEYTVLDGSMALAVPTQYGQHLEATPIGDDYIYWKSLDADGSTWLEVSVALNDVYHNTPPAAPGEAAMLVKTLNVAHNANPAVLQTGFEVVTKLTFPRRWGLGSSSTLITLVAEWFGIDAYKLLAGTFGGSGYDIACAQHNTPLLYTLKSGEPTVTPLPFNPPFADKLYFIYLNKKQNSREAIASYREKGFDRQALVAQVDKLIEELLAAPDVQSFSSGLEKQEALLTGVLGITTVQENLFPDFKGIVKSLGAWGGDFVMAVSEENPEMYFKEKGYTIIIPYRQMVL